ncbi:MAG: tRNA 2-thiouridine(34) synthase MnmA [Candidatus Udaeobacter sp.]
MSGKKQRVLLGMSGGVDSSVAGYLLREQGYEVIGVTMKVWPQDCISRAEDKCCGPQAIADARGVAHSLGIPHYVVDEADQFERLVIDYFSSEYQAGRTPNPCVMCNEKLKFGNLWSKAAVLGCDYIATGHYAVIEHHGDRAVLRKGIDLRKDQSYFLFSLRQPQLQRALTPLGTMRKPQIREIAHSLGLKVADKTDSQEICFVPGNDYKAFLRSHLGENEFHRGEIYDLNGKKTSEFKTGKNTSSSDLRGADSMTDAHFKNFIGGIRSGEKLNAPIAVGNVSVTILQLSNIAWEVNRELALDTKDGKILHDPEAMKGWGREYEKGWAPHI